MTPTVRTPRRAIVIDDVLWSKIQRAAAKAGAKAGKPQSVASWVRSACEQRLEREARTAKAVAVGE